MCSCCSSCINFGQEEERKTRTRWEVKLWWKPPVPLPLPGRLKLNFSVMLFPGTHHNHQANKHVHQLHVVSKTLVRWNKMQVNVGICLTLCEAIHRFRSMATWAHSNLNFWQLWLPQHCHFSHACSWETSGAVDALKGPSFWRKSCRFGPLKLRFPSSPRPSVELHAVLVLVSG